MKQYLDLHVTTAELPRTSIFNLPFSLTVTCTRTGGWELWQKSANGSTLLASEFGENGLRLDVAGQVIIDSLKVDLAPRRDIEEFSVVWFEQTQKWIVLLPDGTIIDRNFGAIGYATRAVYELTGRGEAEFEWVETGDFFRFVKDDEFWVSDEPPEQSQSSSTPKCKHCNDDLCHGTGTYDGRKCDGIPF